LFNQQSQKPKPQNAVSKNSKSYKGPSHRYVIVDAKTGKLYKTGISSVDLNQNGSSARANLQVNKLNKAAGYAKYKAVVAEVSGTRIQVLSGEQGVVNRHAARNNGAMPQGMKLPRPSVGAFGAFGVIQMIFHEYVESTVCEPPNCI
jgi:URI fold toxin 2